MSITIGVVGATGAAGPGLAARQARVGYEVHIGSRAIERAHATVDSLCARWGVDAMDGLHAATNEEAASKSLVILATRASATVHTAARLCDQLSDKVVICMATRLERATRGMAVVLGAAGSVAVEVQKTLPRAMVVAALHHVPAAALDNLDSSIDAQLLVCSDHLSAILAARPVLAALDDLEVLDAGVLANAAGLEAMTAVLISVNISSGGEAALRLTQASPVPEVERI